MQKIRLAEVEVDNKLQADEANKIKQAERMKELEKTVTLNEKTFGKLQRSLDSTKQQLAETLEDSFNTEQMLRAEIKQVNEQLLQARVEIEFEREKY